ncbi:hypothetical protein Dshi_2751 [Dinoroseobacter shibae DFL 12 = DSM 16493]|uniref:Uncharacterized protein n=3 Tax=Dinoroseobacter shibae TaxID=215813 RepID=A8LIP3_DINSH|nr:hypothetical protein Dshi_2751 [Dinoroseobacter shibae DFL 12 = DSM 16493]
MRPFGVILYLPGMFVFALGRPVSYCCAMAEEIRALMSGLGQRARVVAFALVAGIARLCGKPEVDKTLRDLPAHKQRRVTVLALSGLLMTSLLAAQFGWIGMLVFFMAVVLIIN